MKIDRSKDSSYKVKVVAAVTLYIIRDSSYSSGSSVSSDIIH